MGSVTLRQVVILLTLFVGTSVAFIVLDNRTALNPLKTGLSGIVDPVTDRLNRTEPTSVPDSEWERRYDEVEATKVALEAELLRTQAVADRVNELEALNNLRVSNPESVFLSARVTAYDPNGVNKMIVIDRGSADGIREGMVVTDPTYFVGYVTEVEVNSSQVTLVIDSTQKVGAELADSGAIGVVQGLWQNGGRMELRYVDRSVGVKQEEYVVTSCNPDVRTANVPCGIIVGKVAGDPIRDNQADSQIIQMIPAADFDDLSLVAVILSDGGEGR